MVSPWDNRTFIQQKSLEIFFRKLFEGLCLIVNHCFPVLSFVWLCDLGSIFSQAFLEFFRWLEASSSLPSLLAGFPPICQFANIGLDFHALDPRAPGKEEDSIVLDHALMKGHLHKNLPNKSVGI